MKEFHVCSYGVTGFHGRNVLVLHKDSEEPPRLADSAPLHRGESDSDYSPPPPARGGVPSL